MAINLHEEAQKVASLSRSWYRKGLNRAMKHSRTCGVELLVIEKCEFYVKPWVGESQSRPLGFRGKAMPLPQKNYMTSEKQLLAYCCGAPVNFATSIAN